MSIFAPFGSIFRWGLLLATFTLLILCNAIASIGQHDAYAMLCEQLTAVSNLTLLPQELSINILTILSRGSFAPGMDDGTFTILGWSALITLGGTLLGLLPGLIVLSICSWQLAHNCKEQLAFMLKNPLHLLNGCGLIRTLCCCALLGSAFIPLPGTVIVASISWLLLSVTLTFICSFRKCMPY